MVKYVSRAWQKLSLIATALFVVGLVEAGSAFATESEATKKVGEAAGKVSTEGEGMMLSVLTAVVGLIALVIIVPKAIGFIRKFI